MESQEERPPELLKDGNADESSRGMDNTSGQNDTTDTTEERPSRRMDESARGLEHGPSKRMERRVTKVARKGKKRGPNRQTVTLGGEKKMDKSLKRRTKRKMNRDLGKAGISARKKIRMEREM